MKNGLGYQNWPRAWKVSFRVIMILIWIAFIGVITWTGWKNRDLLLPYLIKADLFRFVWVLLFYLSTLVTALIAWVAVMRPVSPGTPWGKHAQIYYLTLAARRLPGTIWYVGGRMVMYQRLGISKTTIAVTSAMETFCLVISGGVIGLIALILSSSHIPSQAIILVIAGILLSMTLLSPPAMKRLLKISGQNPLQTLKYQNILIAFLASGATWLIGSLMIMQLIQAFYPINSHNWFVVLGAWTLSGTVGTLFFFFPSNFGVTEITLTAFLATIMPLPLAGVIAILARLLTTLFEVLISLSFYPIVLRYPLIQSDRFDLEKHKS
jgi:hypothetical protein